MTLPKKILKCHGLTLQLRCMLMNPPIGHLKCAHGHDPDPDHPMRPSAVDPILDLYQPRLLQESNRPRGVLTQHAAESNRPRGVLVLHVPREIHAEDQR